LRSLQRSSLTRLSRAWKQIYNQAAPYVLEAFRRLSNFIKDTAIPAFEAFVEYVKKEILPKLEDTFDIMQQIAKQITEKLAPAVENTLVNAFKTRSRSQCQARYHGIKSKS
jgi:predicted component of type VI protein secretion system